MAEKSILITWGATIPGREKKNLEVFNEALQYFRKLEDDDTIDDFRVGITETGHFDDMAGFMLLEGSRDAIDDVLESKEFRTLLLKGIHIVDNMRVVPSYASDEVPRRVEHLMSVRKELGLK